MKQVLLLEKNMTTTSHVVKDYKEINNLLNGLREFSDEDLNGNNGEDYLWEKAREQGYENNQDYIIDMLDTTQSVAHIIADYFKSWLDTDGYYKHYSVRATEIEDNKLLITLTTEV